MILAHGPGVYVQPSMNQRMWNSPAIWRTIELLTADGHYLLGRTRRRPLTSGIGAIAGTVLATAVHRRQLES